jgi:VWFA-related protein
MRRSFSTSLLLALVASTSSLVAQQPTFRSGVDLIRLDVHVVSDDGTPVTDLTEDDFAVQVNGKASPIRTLQFLDLTAEERPSIETRYRDVSTNTGSMRGRLTVIVIDENSLPEDSRPLMNGVAKYLKGLGPNDKTALVALPRPGLWKDFTADTAELQALLLRASTRSHADVPGPLSTSNSGLGGDGTTVSRAMGDVAVDRGEQADLSLPASMTSSTDPNRDIIYALEGLARRLKSVEGPKTLILVSTQLPEGIGLDDYHAFAETAAAARLTVYVVKPHNFPGSASSNTTSLAQPFAAPGGLDFLAGNTGGIVLNGVGDADGVFTRIAKETSGEYVIGVEPPSGTSRNKPYSVTVKVRRSGVTVRSPKQVVSPASGSRKLPAPKEALGNLLHDPRLATDLPLKVMSYAAQGSDFDRVKAVIVAQLDELPDAKGDVAWGFEVHDGARVISDAFDKRNAHDLTAEPIVTSASLPPGKYSLRFGVVDEQGRRASVDHPLSVGLHAAGNLEYSDVFAGIAVNGHFKPRITADPAAGAAIAILELYGTSRDAFENVSVEFALHGADGVNRAATRARVQAAPNSTVPKGIAQAALSLERAAPGLYDITAAVLVNGHPVGFTKRELAVGTAR